MLIGYLLLAVASIILVGVSIKLRSLLIAERIDSKFWKEQNATNLKRVDTLNQRIALIKSDHILIPRNK